MPEPGVRLTLVTHDFNTPSSCVGQSSWQTGAHGSLLRLLGRPRQRVLCDMNSRIFGP
jgi:hypothetical protein